MIPPTVLAESLVGAFERRGYVHVRGFLDAAELARVRGEVERFLREVAPHMPAAEVYRERAGEPESLKQLQHLDQHDEAFRELLESGRCAQLARLLLGDAIRPRNLQYFDKPPGAGLPTPAHQDGAYYPIEPNRALNLWLALEDVDEEQGCLRFGSGSHLDGLRPHAASGVLGFSRGLEGHGTSDELAREVAVPCAAGDLIAHHSLTIHRAEANRSPSRHRRALGFTYFAASCRVDEAAHADYQRGLAERLRTTGKLRG